MTVSINLSIIFNLEELKNGRFELVYQMIGLVILQIITHNPLGQMETGLPLILID